MELIVDPVVVWTARLVLAAVFGGAAVMKLSSLEAFVGVVHNYRLLPEPLVRPVAYLLPPFEGMVAFGLLVEPARPYAAVAAAVLLVVFAVAMGVNLARGRRDIDCGCFVAVLRQRLSWALVGRNAALLALAFLAMPSELSARSLGWVDVITAVAATATIILLYATYSRLVGLAPTDFQAPGGAR